jgi:hypothetical protein
MSAHTAQADVPSAGQEGRNWTPGCVKTPQAEKRREWFFSDRTKSNTLTNSGALKSDPRKHLFYRLGEPLRFRTAKHCGHPVPNYFTSAILANPHF